MIWLIYLDSASLLAQFPFVLTVKQSKEEEKSDGILLFLVSFYRTHFVCRNVITKMVQLFDLKGASCNFVLP